MCLEPCIPDALNGLFGQLMLCLRCAVVCVCKPLSIETSGNVRNQVHLHPSGLLQLSKFRMKHATGCLGSATFPVIAIRLPAAFRGASLPVV